MKLRCRETMISLDRVAVMGVLNVTPDSFSDGGHYFDLDAAVDRALEMAEQGAAIIDVGGESTRPGAEEVPESEELRRVIPVIERVVSASDVPISIDTRKGSVARAALEAGAAIVNDTLGEAADDSVVEAAVRADAAIVTMHSRGTPATMRSLTGYDDVVTDVSSWLEQRAGVLKQAGLGADQIVLDPGFGFAKAPEHNLHMLDRFETFTEFGYPVLAGTSRKSFIGLTLGVAENRRLEGTAATVAIAVYKGAKLVRVHDVAEMTRVVRMTEAIRTGAIDES
jgi:dihydropteroate synthase